MNSSVLLGVYMYQSFRRETLGDVEPIPHFLYSNCAFDGGVASRLAVSKSQFCISQHHLHVILSFVVLIAVLSNKWSVAVIIRMKIQHELIGLERYDDRDWTRLDWPCIVIHSNYNGLNFFLKCINTLEIVKMYINSMETVNYRWMACVCWIYFRQIIIHYVNYVYFLVSTLLCLEPKASFFIIISLWVWTVWKLCHLISFMFELVQIAHNLV